MKLLVFKLKKQIGMLVREIKVLDLVKENQDLKRDQEYLLEEIDENRYAKCKLESVMSDFEKFVKGDVSSVCYYCRKTNECPGKQFIVQKCANFDYIRRPLEGLPNEDS